MSLSITDLVTENQAKSHVTLREVIETHEELRLEELTSGGPVELTNNISLWEKKEDIPEILPEAQYVIIDTIYFSTTSLEALNNGFDRLWLAETEEEVMKLSKDKSIAAAGESGNDYELPEKFDFFNSPTSVQKAETDAREAVFTSYNGAKAAFWTAEAAQGESKIILGSTTNARAVGENLDKDKPVHIMSAGSREISSAEDHIAAYLISRYYNGNPCSDDEIEVISDLLEITKFLMYDDIPEIRRKDIDNYVKKINSVNIAPELDIENGEKYFE